MKIYTGKLDNTLLSGPLYENGTISPRVVTSTVIEVKGSLITVLEDMTRDYITYLNKKNNLAIPLLPVRADFMIDQNCNILPLEQNTGFVDQFASGLNILLALGYTKQFEDSLKKLIKNRKRDEIVITCPEYKREAELMIGYLNRGGKNVSIISPEVAMKLGKEKEIFCYGYPRQDMVGNKNFVPGGLGLDIESKRGFYEFLDIWMKRPTNQTSGGSIGIIPWYNQSTYPYGKLPKNRDLIFKQDGYKRKGDRQTVIVDSVPFAKIACDIEKEGERSKPTKYRYQFGQMIAQEPVDSLVINDVSVFEKNEEGDIKQTIINKSTVELRALLLPNDQGNYELITLYSLFGPKEAGLINDSNPQGAVLIT